MLLSLEPTCQLLGGAPGRLFSHAITLATGGPHGLPAAAAADDNVTGTTPTAMISVNPIHIRRIRDASELSGRTTRPTLDTAATSRTSRRAEPIRRETRSKPQPAVGFVDRLPGSVRADSAESYCRPQSDPKWPPTRVQVSS